MKLTPATSLAALAAIGAAGFAIGRISAGGDGSEPAENAARDAATVRVSSARAGDAGSGETSRTREARRNGSSAASAPTDEKLRRLEEIVRGENALDRSRALLEFIDQLGPGEFEDAVAHFRGLGITESRFGEYAMLLTAWAEADPYSALAYTTENTRGGFATNTILTAWAARDAEAAVAWAEQAHQGDGANPHLPGIIRGIAGSDPVRATELLTSMPFSRERGDGLNAILPHLMEQGPDAARAWVSEIQDERLREGAMMRVAERLAATDPRGTADWLVSNPGNAADRRLDDVISSWARQDAAAATAYFEALPAGDARSNALRGMVSATAAENPQAAADLLRRYPNDVTDGVVGNLVWSSFRSEPGLAASHIGLISDPGQQERMYRRTLSAWLRRDPDSAQSWIQRTPLPGPVVEHVNRQLAEMQRQ